jgi:hypothetical protein
MFATSLRLAGKSADHTLYHAHPKVSLSLERKNRSGRGLRWALDGMEKTSTPVVEDEDGLRWEVMMRGGHEE